MTRSGRAAPWLVVAGVFAVGAAVRALRFWGEFASWAHWDDTRLAIPAIEILEGILPIHHLGVEYQGASPGYPLAAWFALAGTSPLALDLFCYGVGLAVMWTGYLVARRVLDPRAALLALAVLAVPPLLLNRWAISGNLNYPFLLLIGNLLLVGTHTLFFRRPRDISTVLVLGLLAGFGWWTNPLTLVYLGPLAVLALRTGLLRRARFWLFPVGAFFGGLPAWIYEFSHFPSARFALGGTGSGRVESVLERAAILARVILPELLIVRVDSVRLDLASLAPIFVLGLGAAALLLAVVRDGSELRWSVGAGGRPGTGRGMLWWVLATNVALVLVTARPIGHFYFLPLYSVIPLWLGDVLAWLWGVRRAAGGLALAGLLGFQLSANWTATLGRGSQAVWRWARLEAVVQPMARWLETHGVQRVYWAGAWGLPSFEFTYLAGRRVIAAELWREPFVPDGQLVDAAVTPPIVMRDDPQLTSLRESLRGIGMITREREVPGFRLIEPIPTFTGGFAPITSQRWGVTANPHDELAHYLIDRDAGTGWSTWGAQGPGQWLAVDFGREETVTRVDLLATEWQDIPAGFRVEVSRDGRRWHEVVSVPHYWGPLFFSEHHAFLKVRRGRVQAIFPPERARYLRIEQTGTGPYYSWSARELFAYGPGPPAPAPAAGTTIVEALRREGVGFVYTDPWLSALVATASRGTIGTLASNINLNSYGRSDPPPETLERFRAQPGRAILVGSDADETEIKDLLGGAGIPLREVEVAGYPLLVFLRANASPRRILRDGWRATATDNAERAGLAIDGDRRTRWTSRDPVGAGTSFTLDLGRVRRVSRIRVTPGSREGGPNEVRVDGSTDGVAWTRLEPLRWAGPLYWTGSELLRNGRQEWTMAFPPAVVRFLRLRPKALPWGAPWAIEEITCFE